MSRAQHIEPDYQRYELLKREWVARNPNASSSEYDAAMRRIAALCGV